MEFTDDNFQTEVLDTDQVVLVDFWAEWCGPCRMVGPVVDQLAEEYKGKAKVGKVNVDHQPQTSMKYNVRSIPTLLFIKNGEVVDKHVGTANKQQLAQKLEAHMN